MKKLLLITVMLLVTLAASAKDIGDYNYIVTLNTSYSCEKITLGLLKAKCLLTDGKVITVKLSEIIVYKKDGNILEKMTVYSNNKSTSLWHLCKCWVSKTV